MLKAPSDAQLSIVCLEVELGSGRTERSRHFFVEIVDILFEFLFALTGGQIEWESLGILNNLEVFGRMPTVGFLVHEIPVPSFVSEDTEVLEEFKGNQFGYD